MRAAAIALERERLPADIRLEGVAGADFTSGGNGGRYAVYGTTGDGGTYPALVPGGPGTMALGLRVLAQGADPQATGDAAATGDVDGDGQADLVTGNRDADSVTVRYGSPEGLGKGRAPVTYDQDSAGVPGVTEPGDGFGASVSVGDVDGDDHGDVPVGAPGETVAARRSRSPARRASARAAPGTRRGRCARGPPSRTTASAPRSASRTSTATAAPTSRRPRAVRTPGPRPTPARCASCGARPRA